MNRKLLFYLVALFIAFGANAQNAIVGSGFTSGWTSTSDFEYFGSSIGTSYSRTEQATGTGTQYFRIGVDWGGTVGQHTHTIGSDIAITEGVGYTLNGTSTSSGSMTVNVTSTSHQYIFKTEDAGSSPSMKLVYFKVEGTVRSVSSVSQSPTTVYVGNDVVVTATLSGNFATGQAAWLHYTTDNWSTSSLTKMTGSGTTYTGTLSSVTADEYRYKIITSGDIGSISGADADWYAINENDNTGSDYTFTPVYGNVASGGGCDGNWGTAACWINGSVPGSGVDITVLEDITLNQDATVLNLTIESTKTLSTSGTRTLTISNGGSIANNGTFNTGSSLSAQFAGTATLSGTTSFDEVVINGGVDFGANSNIKSAGSLIINSGGFVNTNAPTYDANSTLVYNTGGSYGRSNEWSYAGSGTSGTDQGFPGNVTVSNSTSLNIENGSTGVSRGMAGSLTVQNGSSASMGAMTAGLIVGDAVNVNSGGTLTLSSTSGGDITVAGAMTNNGTFNNNSRQVSFNGTAAQTISGTFNTTSGTTNNFSYVEVNNSNNSAGIGVNLGTSVYVGNQVALTDGVLILNANNLQMNASASFAGTPTWGNSSSNYVIADGSGKLIQSVSTGGTTLFPIGTEDQFMPMRLQLSSGSTSDFEINLVDPSGVTDTSYSLYHTWDITGSGTIDMDVQWPSDEAGTNFPTTNISFLKKTGSTWSDLSYTATRNGSDPYNASFSSVSCCSQFMPGASSALPVELVDFKGIRHESGDIELSWVTASETNNEGFFIERSVDGKSFEEIDFIEGNGTTFGLTSYLYTDHEANPGVHYYKLIQIDFDGKKTTYGPVVIYPLQMNVQEVTVLPNPFYHDLTVLTSFDRDQWVDLTIISQNGTIVMSSKEWIESGTAFQLKSLDVDPGIYFLKIYTGKSVSIKRVVKM